MSSKENCSDANGDPFGHALPMPKAQAGGKFPKSYPARCAYCKEELHNNREVKTHMTVRHPA